MSDGMRSTTLSTERTTVDTIKSLYTATATAVGGRNGHTETSDGMVKAVELERFVREAHEKICPYSHATRGNVPVTLEVIGK
jgi:organic hydroperoxide reductase OsmC/OhrA